MKEDVLKCVNAHQLNLRNLIGIATDAALSMIGKNSGAVTLILRHIEALKECPSSEREMFICDHFLHLENLCAQVLDMFHFMTVVVKTVNAKKHNSLNIVNFNSIFKNWNLSTVMCFVFQRFGG